MKNTLGKLRNFIDELRMWTFSDFLSASLASFKLHDYDFAVGLDMNLKTGKH